MIPSLIKRHEQASKVHQLFLFEFKEHLKCMKKTLRLFRFMPVNTVELSGHIILYKAVMCKKKCHF